MIFRNWVLQNFPFLEDDFDALTDYELFCKMVEYMKESLEKIKSFQNDIDAFNIKLNEFQHYFDNLDIQEEVDNKLDEMAESGELTDIIAQYLDLAGILAYNTKADLKAAENLANGSIAKTLGNTTYNDGLGNFYKIRTILNTDVIDDDNIIALTNYDNLIAEKIIDGHLNSVYNELNTSILNLTDNTTDNLLKKENLNGGIEFIGHRGSYVDIIENTIPSFQFAHTLGYKYIETDVQPNADGDFILMHNEAVDSLTDGTGNVRELTTTYIEGLTYDSGANVADFPDTKIAFIDDLITFIKETKMKVLLELKNYASFFTNEKVLDLYNILKKNGVLENIIFTCFDGNILTYIRTLDKNVLMNYNAELTESDINLAIEQKFNIIAVPQTSETLTTENVELCHNNNIKVNIYALDTTTQFTAARAFNPDFVTVNNALNMQYERPFVPSADCTYTPYGYFEEYGLSQGRYLLDRDSVAAYAGVYPNTYKFSGNFAYRILYGKKHDIKQNEVLNFGPNFDFTRFKFAFHFYSKITGEQVADSGWKTTSGTYTYSNSAPAFYVAFIAKLDNSTFTYYDAIKCGYALENFVYKS